MSRARDFADLAGSADAGGITGRNLIINGAMNVAQRGTQTGVRNSYGVDRFLCAGDGAQLFTYSQSTTVPSEQGFSYSAKLDVTTADTSVAAGDYHLLIQRFEGQSLQQLKYGTSSAESLTLQFWVRSPKTGTHIVELTHVDAGYQTSQAYTITSADTWQKVIVTFDGYQTTAITNDNTLRFTINWWLMAGSTYSGGTLTPNTWHNTDANRAVGQVNVVDSTSNDFYITGVQLEVGETATPFEHRSFGDELAKCQRYWCQSYPHGTAAGSNFQNTVLRKLANGQTYDGIGEFQFPTEMRAAPVVVLYNPVTGTVNGFRGDTGNFTGAAIHPTTTRGFSIYRNASVTATVFTSIHATCDAEL